MGSLPRLLTVHRDRSVLVDFVSSGELVMDVNVRPAHSLRIRPVSLGARLLRMLGIRPGHRTGDAYLDDAYIIDHATQDDVQAFLTPEVIELLRRLEPFYRFQLTHKEYRCVKHVPDLVAYPPRRAAEDVDVMMAVVDLTLSP
ncbi:hypothetical protein HQ560_04770 [bacterium]|nr:hypothetical protein [bacterium]